MHLLERDPLSILQRVERTESLSKENIRAVVRKYFPPDRHTIVTLMPETEVLETEAPEAEAQPVAAR